MNAIYIKIYDIIIIIDNYYTQYITFSNEEIFNKKIDEMNIDI